MAFIVEDGTGKTNATSYLSVADFESYWTDRGTTFTETDAVIQGWLVSATEYIDTMYKFWGVVTYENVQALQWPREGVRDNKNYLIESDTIPQELKDATARLAIEAQDGSKNLESKLENGLQSKRIGPVSKTYKGSYKADYKVVTNLLRSLIRNNAGLRTVS